MVQNPSLVASDEPTVTESKNIVKGVEEGRYRLVGWAVDTTGRRLIDEICQIAAYTPDSMFSQYIMPFGHIRFLYRKRHSIRVINMGRYRMLKDLHTNKFVKTRSEVSALTGFVMWLEGVKGDASDGIILIFHEFHKYTPPMLLESLRRHGLLERFKKVVKGFTNCYSLSQIKCANTTKSFSLRVMSKVLLNKEEDFSSAVTRAQACYEIVVHLGQSEVQDLDSKGSGDCKGSETHLVSLVAPYTSPVDTEEEEIALLKVRLECQNTFKPVFGALLRATPAERQRATHLRRILAENDIDYDKLKSAFDTDAKDGLENVLKSTVANAKEEDMKDLLEILDCFFDPEKKPIQPKPKFYQNNRRIRKDKENKDKNSNSAPVSPKDEIKTEVSSPPIVVTSEAALPGEPTAVLAALPSEAPAVVAALPSEPSAVVAVLPSEATAVV